MVKSLARKGTISAVVVAGGKGSRFGQPLPKQFEFLAGRPILLHSVQKLCAHPAIDSCVVVLPEDHMEMGREVLKGLENSVLWALGGDTRQHSVLNGLETLAHAETPPSHVLIHDGARPLLSAQLIDRVCSGFDEADGVLPILPIHETVKTVDAEGWITGTADRDGMGLAQTPQGFSFDRILDAHRRLEGASFTDDVGLFEHMGLPIKGVPGDPNNLKITTQADLERAERIMSNTAPVPALPDIRTGQGFDVHRFGPGSSVRIGGIDIAHSHALEGHSDADVALHALTDAVLGAAGAGDIGQHFPPSDPRWKGADSEAFLVAACEMLAAAGGHLLHADITVICEAPRVGPHRDTMRDNVARILGLDPSRLNIKATTTEKLGFLGRGEGIAATAIATAVFA